MHDNRAAFGYIVASIIFTALLYGITIEDTYNLRTECERSNSQALLDQKSSQGAVLVVNTLEEYMQARLDGNRNKIAEGVPVVKKTITALENFEIDTNANIVDCKVEFNMPFPINLVE